MVSVKSKCGRTRCTRTSRKNRYTVATAMTLTNAARNDTPPTPVHSAIWMSGRFACSPMPRSFQPKPENIQPRTHSSAVQLAAAEEGKPEIPARAQERGHRGARALSRPRRRSRAAADAGTVRASAPSGRPTVPTKAPHTAEIQSHVKRQDEPARRRHLPKPVKRAPEKHESRDVSERKPACAGCAQHHPRPPRAPLPPSPPTGGEPPSRWPAGHSPWPARIWPSAVSPARRTRPR